MRGADLNTANGESKSNMRVEEKNWSTQGTLPLNSFLATYHIKGKEKVRSNK